jgi:23S rRNA (uracil1939-C5)-methyltransferase
MFCPESTRTRQPGMNKPDAATARIESLSHEGLGVAHVEGKATFIDGALPGETVHFRLNNRYKTYDVGKVLEVLEPSPDRVTPRCQYFGLCGGCSLQHLRSEAQLLAKEQILRDNLARIGKVQPESWLAPLAGPHWGYRRKARLGVRHVEKKGGVIVGFREKRSSYITPLAACETLHPRVAALLPALRELIAGLSRPDRVPQIEVAVADNAVAFAFRHLVPLSAQDDGRLAAFGREHDVQVFRQPGRPDQLAPVWPATPAALVYRLPDVDVELEFAPADFVQVNAELNRMMVNRALDLLEPTAADTVLDLFCGLGNFTLPLARRAGRVLGIEADAMLIEKGRRNAARNDINNADFRLADLYSPDAPDPWGTVHFSKWLLDPPRTGAIEVVKRLPGDGGPQRILYVSCNPATLARDSEVLVHAKGYRLAAAGAMDMFPQTSHVEAMALFVRAD